MRPIDHERVYQIGSAFSMRCLCGAEQAYTTKGAAIRAAAAGRCRGCAKAPSLLRAEIPSGIKKADDGRWAVPCSGCGNERSYTRLDHAKSSLRSGWLCKKCSAAKQAENLPVGDRTRTYRRFRQGAINRGLDWDLTEEEMFALYDGRCAMTGWPLSLRYGEQTASLDRIDNGRGYSVGNIQWVHVMVNMCRNKYSIEKFTEMCRAVSNKEKW